MCFYDCYMLVVSLSCCLRVALIASGEDYVLLTCVCVCFVRVCRVCSVCCGVCVCVCIRELQLIIVQTCSANLEVLGTSTSDYRAENGTRKHVAIILWNSEIRISCRNQVRKVGTFRYFSAKLELRCQIRHFYEIAEFVRTSRWSPEICGGCL